jgi:alpha-beta hydrolase superfamily lysophospholipase
VFSPPGPSQGSLLLVHGYLAHAGDFAYTISLFVALGWTVITVDLPGHGLSTGPRADIDVFDSYGNAVRSWLGWFRAQEWPGPVVLVAHSLGTAASLDALSQPGVLVPDQVIFCAPLLRLLWYKWLVVGEKVAGWALREVPLQLGSDGYLDATAATVHWFTVLRQWLRRLDSRPPLELPLTILSGDQDQIVDQVWNQSKYRQLVPGHRYVLLPGRDHVFLTAAKDREGAHAEILRLLDQTLPGVSPNLRR